MYSPLIDIWFGDFIISKKYIYGIFIFIELTLNKIPIPNPSFEEKRKIVESLDVFLEMCNDLEKGLPAEIEARHKQYEYYRDKLLTFKRKVV